MQQAIKGKDTDEILRQEGFEDMSDVKATEETVRKKIDDVIKIYNTIDTFNSIDVPEECSNCGNALNGYWVKTDENESIALCRECGGGKSGRGIGERRAAVIDEAEELLCDIEQETKNERHTITQSLNVASANLWNDGEYNYCMRSALVQLEDLVEQSENDHTAILDRIEKFRDRFPQKASLPPRDQITR